ncbi:hypothetical protein FEM48_Zijuj06G0184300 [Ziziphus jujuba var. spinosa]|uniref:C2H2-type domain-containing protein n=1 Tax=Ziziphus jujuba var. spinosa TaxID=714518 RepID=A0A978VAW9_ZIZJJ|nr:hypothetical protein FEM48_Zijuj06G0184300 [Ziziphus jujuba var. spinosa]
MEEVDDIKKPIFRDIRRYFCDYCGICRSKKSLIAAHMLTHHKEEVDKARTDGDGDTGGLKASNTCPECGVSFKKPAYLKQHMQSHSLEVSTVFFKVLHLLDGHALLITGMTMYGISILVRAFFFFFFLKFFDQYQVGRPPEKLHQVSLNHATISLRCLFLLQRPYRCSVEDCHSSYRRKDHLTRHLLQHQGKLFKCPIENCNCEFAIQGNVKRHVRQLHDEDRPPTSEKQYVCQEIGCGKVFRFASRLQKHEDSHVKLDSVEAFCSEPGCMKPFTNEQCLKAHLQSYHQHITCEICGTKQLRKNIKRHLRTHDTKDSTERVKCNYKGCDHTFSNVSCCFLNCGMGYMFIVTKAKLVFILKSNLQQHVKAVHLKRKPFACGFSGCSMRFSYKHVREKHEKTGAHVYIHGDFEETDEQFRSRPRGGRKRKYPTVEMLVRKRVTPPDQSKEGAEYLSWLAQEIQGDA